MKYMYYFNEETLTVERKLIEKKDKKVNFLKATKYILLSSMLGLSLPLISSGKKEPKVICECEMSRVGSNIVLLENKVTYEDIICNIAFDTVKNYAYVFNLKDEVLYDATCQKINSSSITNLRENYNIMGTDKKYENLDIQIILIAKDLIRNPEEYGYNAENIYTTEKEESDLTIREMVYKYADIFDLDKDLMLALACAESGWFKAGIAKNNNNPYSCRSTGDFFKYDTLERGILEGQLNLRLNYFDEGLTTIESFARKYCPEGTDHWLSLVRGVHESVLNGATLYDEENKKLEMRGE